MNWQTITALVWKDFTLFFRNKFFAVITTLGIIAYMVIYFVMPGFVSETLKIAVYAPVMPPVFEQPRKGTEIEQFQSVEELREVVRTGQYMAGIALPPDILEQFRLGEKPHVDVYFAPNTPKEVQDAVETLLKELAYLQVGKPLPLQISEEILGIDMAGRQIPPRDSLRSLFAVLLILTETIVLATLISEEIEYRTIHALLVTPMTVTELFAAKGIMGTGLAFIESALFMSVVGGMNRQPLVVLTALLLGAVMVTGISFFIATLGRDMMSVLAWYIPILVILMVPVIGVLMPGTATGWAKAIPSYYLVNTINKAVNFGLGWSDAWLNLVVLLGFDITIFSAGILALRRSFR